jgi:DNA-damage-inducible protein J
MITKESTIQLRIDTKTKNQAKKTLNEIGLDLSSAIKLFLKNVVITESLPFEVRTRNGFTRAQEQEILKEAEWAMKYSKRYSSVKDLMKDLKK